VDRMKTVVFVGTPVAFLDYLLRLESAGEKITKRTAGRIASATTHYVRYTGGNSVRGITGPAELVIADGVDLDAPLDGRVASGLSPAYRRLVAAAEQDVRFINALELVVPEPTPTREIAFYVEGRPAPQGSKTISPTGAMREQSPYLVGWAGGWSGGKARGKRIHGAVEKALFRWFADNGVQPSELPVFPVDVPVEFTVTFHVETDPVDPPDWDTLSRSTGDALTYGRAWADDGQVTDAHVRIRRADEWHPAGAYIVIKEATL
jgi:hypothetical protein